MTSVLPLTRVGPYRVLVSLGGRGSANALASEDGPGGFRRIVWLQVVDGRSLPLLPYAAELARSAAAGARLDHPHVLRTLRFFADPVGDVAVFEYLGGATLAELLDAARATGERWSDDAILQIGAAVCAAFAHGHGQVDGAGRRAPVTHGGFDAHAVHLGRDGSIKVAGFGHADVPESTDRADVGRLLWQLLARRPSTALDEPLATVRYDLPPEVSAAVEAARAPGNAGIGLAQLAAWLDKSSRAARAREEIVRRVTAHIAPRQALLLRAARSADPNKPALARRDRLVKVGAGAAFAAVACASFAVGRVSHHRAALGDAAPLVSAAVQSTAPEANALAAVPSEPPSTPVETHDDAAAPAISAPTGTSGWLTVHSPLRSGYVYVHLLRSGRVDDRIQVICGKRFVSLGWPSKKGHEPVWLAPSQYVKVPCGGDAEITIVPRSAKRRGR